MGSIIMAICECGYSSQHLFVGGGRIDHDKLTAPAICTKCKTVIERNYLKPPAKCPKCRRKVKFYNEPVLQSSLKDDSEENNIFEWHMDNPNEDFFLPDTNYLCPVCGQTKMKFLNCGCWD